MRVLGVDPAKEIAKKATDSGIPTLPDFLTLDLARQIKKDHGPAAAVCAFNVFAHADKLGDMVDSIRELLAPEGLFVFEVSYLLDIVEHMLLGTIFHEHLSHHSMKPMVSFLRVHKLELIDARRNLIQGGSVVGTAQLGGGPRSIDSSVGELLALEQGKGLDRPGIFKEFAAKLQKMKTEVTELTADLRARGKSLWGYGAARSGTTLISQMNLGKVISFIVDDSPDKQNKFSPGDHIPICLPGPSMK